MILALSLTQMICLIILDNKLLINLAKTNAIFFQHTYILLQTNYQLTEIYSYCFLTPIMGNNYLSAINIFLLMT